MKQICVYSMCVCVWINVRFDRFEFTSRRLS